MKHMKQVFLPVLLPLIMVGCGDPKQPEMEMQRQGEDPSVATRIVEPTLETGALTGDDLAAFAPVPIQKWVLSLPAGEYKLDLHVDVNDPTGDGIGGSIDCKALERMTFPIEEAETISMVIKFPGKNDSQAVLFLYTGSSSLKIPLGKAFSAVLVPGPGEKDGIWSQTIEEEESNGRIQNFKLGEISFERTDVSADGKPMRRDVVLRLNALQIEPVPVVVAAEETPATPAEKEAK